MSRSIPGPSETSPFVALGLTGAQALHLLGDGRVRARIARDPAFTVVGIDRLSAPEDSQSPADVDPSVVATALAAEGAGPLLVSAVARREHPYNLARRVLSLDHLSHGTSGLVLGQGNPHGAGEGGEDSTAPDTAAAVTGLWQSWPRDSIIGDKDAGVLVDAARIRRVDHTGVVDVAGPLSVPSSLQGTPVLGWYAGDHSAVRAAPAIADLVLLGGSPDVQAVRDAVVEINGRAILVAEIAVPVPTGGEGAALDEVGRQVAALTEAGAAGVVLRTAQISHPADDIGFLLDVVLPALSTEDGRAGRRGTLRDRLGATPPEPLLADARGVFPPPTTSVYQ
ncbi:LLM class flavin-dependent oxidoreductase [Rhodococcus zopfii]|uniref:LLM class flavin-dependent oxidoreductase n=1 Tax=Rhodococcus zopfii TaxID=43772 RepID=UPI001486E4B9|nr:LLM class flavin-dependent oxidoreductase [Rhodococcus zopfii]